MGVTLPEFGYPVRPFGIHAYKL